MTQEKLLRATMVHQFQRFFGVAAKRQSKCLMFNILSIEVLETRLSPHILYREVCRRFYSCLSLSYGMLFFIGSQVFNPLDLGLCPIGSVHSLNHWAHVSTGFISLPIKFNTPVSVIVYGWSCIRMCWFVYYYGIKLESRTGLESWGKIFISIVVRHESFVH